jgi:hypothetical protein
MGFIRCIELFLGCVPTLMELMMKRTATLGLFAALSISASAFAPNLTGNWKGKMSMDMAALKKKIEASSSKMSPEQKKQVQAQMSMAENMFKTMVFDLNVKGDGTYTMKSPAGMGKGSGGLETGKWTLKGNTVTMTDNNAKAGMKVISGNLAKNGRTIVFDLSSVAKAEAAKRGGKGADVPPMLLTFTKS